MSELIKLPPGEVNTKHLTFTEVRTLRDLDEVLSQVLWPFEQAFLAQFSPLSEKNQQVMTSPLA